VILKRDVSLDEVEQCQVLFVSVSEQFDLLDILSRINKKAILPVSDIGNFVEQGGMINLLKEENHIRLVVNMRATREGSMKLSSKLLTVARLVEN